ncbi:MAG: MBL fold metallo-hydrolase [Planctomycetota bacterium]|jgi:glyoxylase-like metal-dependent hydrolase (beta-lactamase superfamily II)
MKIDRLILGAFETNCYILRESEPARDCLIVDTGLEAGELIDFLQHDNLNPLAVVLTHGHADHITGVTDLRRDFPSIKVYVHNLDADMLTGARDNLSVLPGSLFSTGPADFLLEEGAAIDHAGIKFRVLHTPGHTPGGICLYAEDDGIVFVGDTLFAGSVGRTDFPGASWDQLIESIRERLLILPDETAVYPGHGPTTTIAQERRHNPFLR